MFCVGVKFLWISSLCGVVVLACQHQRTAADDGEALKFGKVAECEEPRFEMKYKLGAIMPAYIDLGVEMWREPGPFFARFGRGDNYDTEIRVDRQTKGLMASIFVRQPSGKMEKKVEGLIVDRYGKNEPFMLEIESGADSGDPLAIRVKAREMPERKNRGIVSGAGVTALMASANPEYLQVSSHHHGEDIVTEGGSIEKHYHMKNGINRDQTISNREFQNVAESYLRCKFEQNKRDKPVGKGLETGKEQPASGKDEL